MAFLPLERGEVFMTRPRKSAPLAPDLLGLMLPVVVLVPNRGSSRPSRIEAVELAVPVRAEGEFLRYSLLLLEFAFEGRTADFSTWDPWTARGWEGAGARKSRLFRKAAPLDRVV